MRFSLGVPFIALFFALSVKAETCLPVQGLQFEKIGSATLLIMKDGKNWGTMDMGYVPDGKLEFRFFTPTICDGSQNDKIQINGKLISIMVIKPFK
jgi:hypothetical protein